MQRIITRVLVLLASYVLMVSPVFADDVSEGAPFPAAPVHFVNEKGETQTLVPEKGKLTIVHFWATWCAPCIDELPGVDAMQKAYGDKVKVIAISLDGDGAANMTKVKNFLQQHKLTHLTPYLDKQMASFNASKVAGLPSTLFIDQVGMEIGRAEGPVEWGTGEVKEFMDGVVK